ncbi:HPr family phosphocarrier protein [Spirochaeta cellobiosiphila]|uniref:HPr family phosphocarrier protein n=1 Tax=Spirochaeta cellobiosiphila TaxID=504483 RepID=UPI0003FD7CDC|nr:HPr family phosphocarrier protein [Spirochaeta cellobiosiphila]
MFHHREDLTVDEINSYLEENLSQLFSYYKYLKAGRTRILNSLLISKILNESTRIEEVLDLFGAKSNTKWFPFREANSAVKRFSNVLYIFLHVHANYKRYKLKSDSKDFYPLTGQSLHKAGQILLDSLDQWYAYGQEIKLTFLEISLPKNIESKLPLNKLNHTRKKLNIKSPDRYIVNMATSFLNLFTNTEVLELCPSGECDYASFIPEQISEKDLRSLETEFHNLQSFYDTNIGFTSVEDYDDDLPLIRGHASIIFHLLEGATDLIHYYERHMMEFIGKTKTHNPMNISQEDVLSLLFDYCLKYSRLFLDQSISLCQSVIAAYAHKTTIEVPVPVYRGFHVRPSTLIAKIVQHYGSQIWVYMDDFKCNAAVPLDLFRLNEKINAVKRKNISNTIMQLDSLHDDELMPLEQRIHRAFQELMEKELIISYSLVPHIPECKKVVEESFGEYINRIIAYMLAEGKIDIRTDIKVKFEGDSRVLKDIKILAENGYGEDEFGNNIILPKELSYLRR